MPPEPCSTGPRSSLSPASTALSLERSMSSRRPRPRSSRLSSRQQGWPAVRQVLRSVLGVSWSPVSSRLAFLEILISVGEADELEVRWVEVVREVATPTKAELGERVDELLLSVEAPGQLLVASRDGRACTMWTATAPPRRSSGSGAAQCPARGGPAAGNDLLPGLLPSHHGGDGAGVRARGASEVVASGLRTNGGRRCQKAKRGGVGSQRLCRQPPPRSTSRCAGALGSSRSSRPTSTSTPGQRAAMGLCMLVDLSALSS